MSRYRYLSRTSSLTSAEPSTGNGSGSAWLSTSTSSTTTSISPVGSSGFSFPAGRARTVPVTSTQNSALSSCAVASSLRHTTCTTPLASRRSMKTTPPWSLRRATQPASTTCSPACDARSVPASWVRIIELCPSPVATARPRRAAAHFLETFFSERTWLRAPVPWSQAPAGSGRRLQARQERVRPAFGADGRLGSVPGQHHGLVRQGQADPRQAAQDRRVVPAGQVGPPDRSGEQQVTREQYATVDFAFTLCCNRRVQWQPECHGSSGVPRRVVHDDLEPHKTQSHPIGEFFYVIGLGEFQAAEQLLFRAERETLGW